MSFLSSSPGLARHNLDCDNMHLTQHLHGNFQDNTEMYCAPREILEPFDYL
jgi:hypothetical protein